MLRIRNKLFDEVHRFASAENLIDLVSPGLPSLQSFGSSVSEPLMGDGIEMGSQGINDSVIELKQEYIDEYGLITTEEAKLVFKNIFPEGVVRPMLEIENYTDKQREFALDVAANALVLDYDSFAAQFNRLKPWGMIKAAFDLWDTPDADDIRDELNDGFDDLSSISRAVVHRYNHVAMGHGGISAYFKSLK